MGREGERPPSDRELSELAALADGSLPPSRREQVESRVAGSAALGAELQRQRAALRAVRAAQPSAPARLRLRLEAERRAAGARWRRWLAVGSLAAACGTALLLVLVPADEAPRSPTVAAAAELGGRPPTGPPPGRYEGDDALLALSMQGVRFPRWQERFGWRAVGVRHDRLGDRGATTVRYAHGGRTLAYTIVGDRPLPAPRGTRRPRGGVDFTLLRAGGRSVVSWLRGGRTCVVSAGAVPAGELLELAAWRAPERRSY